ncbi:Ubiquinone biosynthesis protein COQ4, mitochondrial [Thelohanellus kitauei]|uniref:Ubiquinone biosynthesis protein COQ4, mitochondrial n=1 Tax=Thelohanellus kitauei TaxID=669202 RepID=A0A0C2MEE2_THEKT|nr:Ubiquinone biosynthesis protein COQ4, mitochondrial [Thelohanellus kitauei]
MLANCRFWANGHFQTISGKFEGVVIDSVATFGDVTAYYTLKKLQIKMLKDKTGRRILREKPSINSSVLDPEKLIKYPKNTLGYVYSEFMIRNKISSDTREPVSFC